MYSFISGRIVAVTDGIVVIENNGIGFEINVSTNTLANCSVGKNMQLHTYLQVKEDMLALYGFSSLEEKSMFLKLITISGVGPKMALQVLSGMEINSLIIAIASEDIKTLATIKGLGKKTAQRICLELKEQVDMADYNSVNDMSSDMVASGGLVSDALFALATLGISKTDAYKAVIEASQKTDKLEEVITYALRSLDVGGRK